jgi:aspartate carbamoyltransferase catalytic subunit
MTGFRKTNALQVTAGDGSGDYNTSNFADIFTVTNTTGSVTNYLDSGAITNAPVLYYRVRVVP